MEASFIELANGLTNNITPLQGLNSSISQLRFAFSDLYKWSEIGVVQDEDTIKDIVEKLHQSVINGMRAHSAKETERADKAEKKLNDLIKLQQSMNKFSKTFVESSPPEAFEKATEIANKWMQNLPQEEYDILCSFFDSVDKVENVLAEAPVETIPVEAPPAMSV